MYSQTVSSLSLFLILYLILICVCSNVEHSVPDSELKSRPDTKDFGLKQIEGTGLSMSACREIAVSYFIFFKKKQEI